MIRSNENNFQTMMEVTAKCEVAVEAITKFLEGPELVSRKEDVKPRYARPSTRHFQLLMAVRLVSSANASIRLLQAGYAQETGVLIRTMEEFMAKILCIEEAHSKRQMNAEQKKVITEYFGYDIDSADDVLSGNPWWASMRRMFASQARFLCDGTPTQDTYKIQKMSQAIYDAYTGYVHGFYPHIMEMYENGTEHFRMSGMAGTRRVDEMLGGLASCILRMINTIAQIVTAMGMQDLRKQLIETRNRFMQSEAYHSANK